MSKKDDIQKIWQESFKEPRPYVAMFFDKVYRDDEAMTLADADGNVVSSLLLQHYEMTFGDSRVPVSYIMGAATRRSQRGKGYMSELITRALRESAARGDMLCALIPSSSALYYFYDRYGFSTVFYTKEQRFTSAHTFPVKGEYAEADNPRPDDVWEAFDRFQRMRRCYVTHTRRQFEGILADLAQDNGRFVVVTADDEDSGPRIVSMAWGVPKDDLVVVTDCMGESDEARTAAMRALRSYFPGKPFLLLGRPTDAIGGRLMPRGMARIVNVSVALGAVAAAHPDLKATLRVTDRILPEINTGTFRIADGVCTLIPDPAPGMKLDFDVTVDVLADIIFSSPRIGEVLRFPSERPMISLMLD